MKKYRYIVGVDEVGRGPLAGPVTVCALLLPYKYASVLKREKDSKQLSERQREEMVLKIKDLPGVRFKITSVSSRVIDVIGIERATRRALDASIKKLGTSPRGTFIYLDGRLHANRQYEQETVIRGDEKIPVISYASILAKVYRDRLMARYDSVYPGYGFAQHAGYGTKGHYSAIKKLGASPIHRRSFLH